MKDKRGMPKAVANIFLLDAQRARQRLHSALVSIDDNTPPDVLAQNLQDVFTCQYCQGGERLDAALATLRLYHGQDTRDGVKALARSLKRPVRRVFAAQQTPR